MNQMTQFKKTTIPPLLIALTLVSFALSPTAWAVVPAPDGGYPGQNTVEGEDALFSLTSGTNNTAAGFFALYYNTTGDGNTANGAGALLDNTTGGGNTATGSGALSSNNGNDNTATGSGALSFNIAGSFNTAMGSNAGGNITGSSNVCIGEGVGGEGGVDDSTYIRNVNTLTQNFSAGVNDYVTVRLSDGRLGHTAVVSSQRYKQDIQPLAAASQALYALKPVSFRLKKEFDPTQALGFGLIAEEVEKVDPALVYRNAKGQVESVRYEMVNAMLLNEFLKEHRKVEQQQSTIEKQEAMITELKSTVAQQQKGMEVLTAQLNEQAAQIQKVSAQIELRERAPHVAINKP